MVRRPAHSGNAAVARFPRSRRHGVAPAAGLAPAPSGTHSRCTATRSPPGPYHDADSSVQPRELTPAFTPKKADRRDRSPYQMPEVSRPSTAWSTYLRIRTSHFEDLNAPQKAKAFELRRGSIAGRIPTATERGPAHRRTGLSDGLRSVHVGEDQGCADALADELVRPRRVPRCALDGEQPEQDQPRLSEGSMGPRRMRPAGAARTPW